MLNIVIFGAPGSGKGTQSERLIRDYNLLHISTGELLRDHIARGTDLGKTADKYISNGQLIPDELMIRVLAHHIENNLDKIDSGIIFDGFPRTIPQAEALGELLIKYSTEIHAVIGLEVDEDELIRRMIERGRMSGRSDDNPETIKKRLDVYHNSTSPLRDFYKNKKIYHSIDGNGDVDSIYNAIRDSLSRHGL